MMRSHTRNANSASSTASDLEQEVTRIASLNKDELRALWRKTNGQAPPEALSRDLIARVLTQALQEARFGGLAPNLRKQLATWAKERSENARYVIIRPQKCKRSRLTQIFLSKRASSIAPYGAEWILERG